MPPHDFHLAPPPTGTVAMARLFASVAATPRVPIARGTATTPGMVTHRADLDLVERCLAGDLTARNQLGERLACMGRILAARNRRLSAPLADDLLDEVTGEVSVQIWRKLSQYNGYAAIESWLYRFCELTLLNAVRRQSRRRAENLQELPEPTAPEQASGPDHELVHRALAQLPDEELAVVRGRHFDDSTFEALAVRLRIPVATAKGRYYRGIMRLRHWLGGRIESRTSGGEP